MELIEEMRCPVLLLVALILYFEVSGGSVLPGMTAKFLNIFDSCEWGCCFVVRAEKYFIIAVTKGLLFVFEYKIHFLFRPVGVVHWNSLCVVSQKESFVRFYEGDLIVVFL